MYYVECIFDSGKPAFEKFKTIEEARAYKQGASEYASDDYDFRVLDSNKVEVAYETT